MTDDAKRVERLETLFQAGRLLHSTLEPEEALKLIVRESVRITRAAGATAAMLNPVSGMLEVQAVSGTTSFAPGQTSYLRDGLLALIARGGKPILVPNVAHDSRPLLLKSHVLSALAVPLLVNEEAKGVLAVESDRVGSFTADDQIMLEALAREAAEVIQHTWLFEQLRVKAQLLESLARVNKTINSAVHVDEALQLITKEAAALVKAKMCSLMLLNDARDSLTIRASFGAGPAYLQRPPLSVEESFVGVAVRLKKALQLENVQESTQYQHVSIAREEGIVSLLTVPLIFSGKSIGVLNVYTGRPYSFSNEEMHVLSAFADLSALAIERARLYERVVDTEEQLRRSEKLSALGLLAAEVAHEIRNPLAVMKMLFHSLDLNFPAGDPRSKDADLMLRKMDHLNGIVERILDFARTTEPRLAAVDVNQRITEVILLVRHKLQQQNVVLCEDLHPRLPPAMGEAAHLDQAFLNLVLNAAEAMPSGGTLTIRSGLETASGMLCVSIEDTGPGMSQAQQERAFTSLLATNKAKGTGLGLAIVGRIIESHKGSIQIRSSPGQGTRMVILLPVAR